MPEIGDVAVQITSDGIVKLNTVDNKAELVTYVPPTPITLACSVANATHAKGGYKLADFGDDNAPHFPDADGRLPVFSTARVQFAANFTDLDCSIPFGGSHTGAYSYDITFFTDPDTSQVIGEPAYDHPNGQAAFSDMLTASGSASCDTCSESYSLSGWSPDSPFSFRCGLVEVEAVDSPPFPDVVDYNRCGNLPYVFTHLADWISTTSRDHATGLCSYTHSYGGHSSYSASRSIDIQLSDEYFDEPLIARAIEDVQAIPRSSYASQPFDCGLFGGGTDANIIHCDLCVAFSTLSGDKTSVTVQAMAYHFEEQTWPPVPTLGTALVWDETFYPAQRGTATGLVINHVGGYAAGETILSVAGGSGTILPGEIVRIAGSSHEYTVESYAVGVLVIARPGLAVGVLNTAAIAVLGSGPTSVSATKSFLFNGEEHQTSEFLCLPPTELGVIRIRNLRWTH